MLTYDKRSKSMKPFIWTLYFHLQVLIITDLICKLDSPDLHDKPDKLQKKLTLLSDHMAGSLSQRQAVINWTLMITLKMITLMFLPNSKCQLQMWFQVTTAALARRLCWYGSMPMDEKKGRLMALIGLGIIEHSADVFFLFCLCIRWCWCGMAARI